MKYEYCFLLFQFVQRVAVDVSVVVVGVLFVVAVSRALKIKREFLRPCWQRKNGIIK